MSQARMSIFSAGETNEAARASPWLRSILTSKKLVLDAKGCNPSSAVRRLNKNFLSCSNQRSVFVAKARVLKTRSATFKAGPLTDQGS